MRKNITQGVYCFRNKINNKRYVGSSKTIEGRKSANLCRLRKGNHYAKGLQEDFNKYGEENFIFEILEIVLDETILRKREEYWSAYYDCCNEEFGYNKHKKTNNYLYHTSIQTKRISEKTKGKIISVECRERLKKVRKHQVDCGQIPILQFTKEGEFIAEFSSIKEITKMYGIPSTNICRCLDGYYSHTGGYIWKRKIKNDRRNTRVNQLSLRESKSREENLKRLESLVDPRE